jgi:hypothetical protein
LQSAIRIPLLPRNYTAVLSGKNNTTGVGLEVYDIEKSVSSALSSRSLTKMGWGPGSYSMSFLPRLPTPILPTQPGWLISTPRHATFLRSLAAGVLQNCDTAIQPTSLQNNLYPPTVSSQADKFADAVINSRPLLSTAALSAIRDPQGQPFFGNPNQYNGSEISAPT